MDESLSEYYDSLRKVKILSKQEEKEAHARYLRGDSRAGEKLIESCLRLCFSIAKNYWKDNNPETLKDLISSGNEGLLKALDKFDPSKDVKFSTYSAYWVLMYVRKHIVEDSKVVKPPISVRRKSKLQDVSADSSSNILYKEAQDYNTVCSSLTPDEVAEEVDQDAYSQVITDNLLRFLTTRERYILSKTYGLGGGKPSSLCKLASKLDLSSERVRQIRESATHKLRCWGAYYSS